MAAQRSARRSAPQAADERLLVEAAQSDPAKFDALYELHFERVYSFVVRRVRDRAIAEDLTADVFHKALANITKYEWRGAPFAAWLFRIAANTIADHSNRSAREAPAAGEPLEHSAAPGLQPSDLDAIEVHSRIFRLVRELPDPQRLVVHQRFVEQRSIREIAQRLGKTEGAIKQLQFRALQSLRAQMEGSHA
jgi:RNA polymerase sigma-70 factor (ECF subfamily)